MKKLKIIADNKIPFLKGALEDVADVLYLPGKDFNNQIVKNADAIIIRTRTVCNEELLAGTSVKFIATATIGYDHIDTDWCAAKGIKWTNAPGCNSSSVQQYMLSAFLNLFNSSGINPEKLTIGIIGVGNVGAKVAEASGILGMKVLLNDPPRERNEKEKIFCSLDKIVSEADIISFHVPLIKEGIDKTFHMADSSFFDRLNKRVLIFNTSRGEVVNSDILKQAIAKGKVKDSILDVWENEPDIDTELLKMSRFGTAHIAGYSTDGKINGSSMSIRSLSKFFGLGMDDWYPASVPGPEDPLIIYDCSDKNELDILREIYNKTYNISADDRKLRDNPGSFESLRGNYPLRREPTAYRVKLINNPYSDLQDKLDKLGFQIL